MFWGTKDSMRYDRCMNDFYAGPGVMRDEGYNSFGIVG
jgi:hypothetical protein